MRNVTLPTPVFVAGGALCLLAGYLVGSLAPGVAPDRTTATVASFNSRTAELCLEGEAIEEEDGVDSDGTLCGTWRRSAGSRAPSEGDEFRFVAVRTSDEFKGKQEQSVVFYGDVVG